MSDTPSHPIQAVVKRTGLSAHVIRIWEKRYGAVTPHRTQTNRRLYSDEEIERLSLLRRLSEAGQGIGYVAKLPTNRLKALAMDAAGSGADGAERLAAGHGADAHVRAAVVAVQRLDAPALGEVLKRAELELGAQGVLQRVIAPLAQQLGDLWREGTITAAHEHFATAVLRVFLGRAARPFAAEPHGPVLVVVTPAGQLHELGALLAGATAANLGWRVVYLGASLAAADIAGAAKQNQARAVALSIVYPEDDPLLKAELTRLRELLPDTPILAGGRATPAYRRTLDEIGAVTPADLAELGTALDRIRRPVAGRIRSASA
jgi:MerR family transcriptional regulator, light-induced transcriptional regulator